MMSNKGRETFNNLLEFNYDEYLNRLLEEG